MIAHLFLSLKIFIATRSKNSNATKGELALAAASWDELGRHDIAMSLHLESLTRVRHCHQCYLPLTWPCKGHASITEHVPADTISGTIADQRTAA